MRRRVRIGRRNTSAEGGSVIFAVPPTLASMAKKARRRSYDSGRAPRTSGRSIATMPFDRLNYVLLLGAVGLIVLGYALMLFDNATNPNPVDSTMSLFISPLLLLAGYLGVAGAVLWGVPKEAGPTADEVQGVAAE